MRNSTPKRWSFLLIVLVVLATGCTLNNMSLPGETISGVPVVRIILPQPNATYMEGVAVNIQAAVSNAGADIDRVEIVIDGEIAATITDVNPNNANTFNVTHGWSARGVGAHSIDVTAFRTDGSNSEPATVNITVVTAQAGQATATVTAPTATQQTSQQSSNPPTQAQNTQSSGESSSAPATAVPDTSEATSAATPSQPTANFAQGINVRRGPSLAFDPPLGAFAAGQSAQILAMSSDGTWYKVRYGSGEGWVFAPLTEATGDVASLPREAGPPLPPPTSVPPTSPPAIAATAAPASNANLVAGIVELSVGVPTCQQTFNIGLDVANLGSEATTTSGTISVNDVRSADGTSQQTTLGGFPVIQPGQTVRIDMPLTVSTYYNEEHTIILIIDPNNQIAETEEGDNRREVRYTLQQGSC